MRSELAISALFLLAAPFLLPAQDFEMKRRPANVPEQYEVKQGDTLWDISNEFLGNPFSWPELWQMNSDFIRDPHWIYPGQIISFGLKPMPMVPSPPEAPVAAPAPAPEKVPEPVLEASVPETAAPAPVDKNVIRLLREPRPVFTEKNFMRTGFITMRSEISRSRIVRIEGEQASAIRYDTIIIDRGTLTGVREGEILAVIEVGDAVKHPETGRNYGVVVRIKGILSVLSAGEKQSRCTVTETFDPLEVDDRVMPYTLSGGPLFDAWIRPETTIHGIILAINDPMLSIHIDDILYIDKGERDGVRAGDVYTVYKRKSSRNDTGYIEPLGELEAISVMPGETAVIVSTLHGEDMHIGDRVELTARCRLAGE